MSGWHNGERLDVTLEDVGRALGVSAQRAMEIERKALNKLWREMFKLGLSRGDLADEHLGFARGCRQTPSRIPHDQHDDTSDDD